ncbi:glycosyltransferase family 9 protein [candidate division TA06 bacterium]|uniref:Glycosyltransferase family 9 protein n=1 Tax=candidate division TA06 bacterium TaxID=2250710 RepID=A0A933IA86_UNCT6|nr:glycosyltransferase family 9 protein [candidate division TA06 bacterium]
MPNKQKILVVRHDRLGDAINAVPVLMALKKAKPEAVVTYMAASAFVELFTGQPYLDEVSIWPNNLWHLVKALRRGHYDVLLMLHPSKLLAWAALFAGVKQKAGLGFRPYYVLTGFKHSHNGRKLSAPPGFDTSCGNSANGGAYRNDGHVLHETEYNFSVARSIFDLPKEIEPPQIFLSDTEEAEAKNVLMSMNVRTPIAVLPANRGSSANWEPERYRQLVQKLVETKQEVLILGGPGEEEILSRVKGETNAPTAGPDLTLRRLAAILANCRQVIGSSTGTLHLAAAAGAKTVGLFCPAPASRPERWRPLGEEHVQLVPVSDYCEKCKPDAKCNLGGIALEKVLGHIFINGSIL